jgi:hypothetical protein
MTVGSHAKRTAALLHNTFECVSASELERRALMPAIDLSIVQPANKVVFRFLIKQQLVLQRYGARGM